MYKVSLQRQKVFSGMEEFKKILCGLLAKCSFIYIVLFRPWYCNFLKGSYNKIVICNSVRLEYVILSMRVCTSLYPSANERSSYRVNTL
jgi:hypothetical protein